MDPALAEKADDEAAGAGTAEVGDDAVAAQNSGPQAVDTHIAIAAIAAVAVPADVTAPEVEPATPPLKPQPPTKGKAEWSPPSGRGLHAARIYMAAATKQAPRMPSPTKGSAATTPSGSPDRALAEPFTASPPPRPGPGGPGDAGGRLLIVKREAARRQQERRQQGGGAAPVVPAAAVAPADDDNNDNDDAAAAVAGGGGGGGAARVVRTDDDKSIETITVSV